MLSDRNYRRISDAGTVVFYASLAYAGGSLIPMFIQALFYMSEEMRLRNEAQIPFIFLGMGISAATHYLLRRFIPGHIPVMTTPLVIENIINFAKKKIPSWTPLDNDEYLIHRRSGFNRAVRYFVERHQTKNAGGKWRLRGAPDATQFPCTLKLLAINGETVNTVECIVKPYSPSPQRT